MVKIWKILLDMANERKCREIVIFIVSLPSFHNVLVSLFNWVITGRNEVVAKVVFLLMSVILLTGGCLPQCMLGYHPPWEQTPPGSRPPWEQTNPRSRHLPGADNPPGSGHHPPEQTPPGSRPTRSRHPPGKQTQAYGQSAAGTHPTGIVL